jgi:hypothetical protein
VDTKRRFDVIYRPLPYGSVPIKFTCSVPSDATVKDIKVWLRSALTEQHTAAATTAAAAAAVAEVGDAADASSDVTVSGESQAGSTAAQRLPQAPPLERMVAFEAYLHRVYKKMADSHSVSDIKDDDVIAVCEVEHEHTPAPVVLRLGNGASLYKPAAVKTEVKPAVKIEVKPEVKIEVKTEVKTEGEGDIADSTAEAVKIEVKPEVKPEVKIEVKSEEAAAPAAAPAEPVKVHEVDVLQSKPSSTRYIQPTLFGMPARISYTEGTTNRQMHEILRQHVSRYFKEQLPPVDTAAATAAAAAAVPADVADTAAAAAATDADTTAATAGEATAESDDAQMSADAAAVLGTAPASSSDSTAAEGSSTATEPAATAGTADAGAAVDADAASDMQVDSSAASTPAVSAAAAGDDTADSTAATPSVTGADSMDVSAAATSTAGGSTAESAGALIPYVPPETDSSISAAFKAAAAAIAAAAEAQSSSSPNNLYKLLLTDMYGRGSSVKLVPVNDEVFVSSWNQVLTVELTAAGVEALDSEQVEACIEHATVKVRLHSAPQLYGVLRSARSADCCHC